MDRRNFLRGSAVAATGATLAAPAIAQSKPKVTWRLASSYPKSLDTLFASSEEMAKAVYDLTDGQFEIQVFAAGELVPPLGIADSVGDGTVEMGHTGSYFYMGKDPAFAFGTAMPWSGNARQYQAWMHEAGGNDLLNEVLANFNLINLPAGNTGTQMAGWYRKEINTLDDLKGLKMRIGGMGGTVMSRMGVIPQQIAGADMYPALERGVLDAIEFVGPADDERLGFYKVAKYYYAPAFWEPSGELSYFINADAHAALPPAFQAALKHASKSSGAQLLHRYDARNAAALQRLLAEGTIVRTMPEEILRESYRQTHMLYAEMSEESANFKKIHDHMFEFMGKAKAFTNISGFAYDYVAYQAEQGNWPKS
ncbi:substrate-binding domain-containing protein [Roseovarius aestuarii]|nr:substrate-binding domain-containing protein [Roseovarius aestuarii]